jgi:hypothetical protein
VPRNFVTAGVDKFCWREPPFGAPHKYRREIMMSHAISAALFVTLCRPCVVGIAEFAIAGADECRHDIRMMSVQYPPGGIPSRRVGEV